MLSKELIDYLSDCKKKEIAFHQIKSLLIQTGYDPATVHEAAAWYRGEPVHHPHTQSIPHSSEKMHPTPFHQITPHQTATEKHASHKTHTVQRKRSNPKITLLITIGILVLLVAGIFFGLIKYSGVHDLQDRGNFAKSNDAKRQTDVQHILTALVSYQKDHRTLPKTMPKPGAPARDIATGIENADLCTALLPTYLNALPSDPIRGNPQITVTDCLQQYDTKYMILVGKDGKTITVSAKSEITGKPISASQ